MCLLPTSDPATLWRTASVVRLRRDVGDGAHLEASGGQRTDGGLPARTPALDRDVDLSHAVLHGAARGRLRGQLRGERSGLPRTLESDLTGGRPRDHGTGRVRDGHDRVVERALDVRLPVGDVLSFLAPHLLDGGGAGACLW